MTVSYSKNRVPIRITSERIDHIISGHPEMYGQTEQLIETLKQPDFIQLGDSDELLAVKLYNETPVTFNKYLVVVYKEVDINEGFLLTAYYTRKPSSRRETVWKA